MYNRSRPSVIRLVLDVQPNGWFYGQHVQTKEERWITRPESWFKVEDNGRTAKENTDE